MGFTEALHMSGIVEKDLLKSEILSSLPHSHQVVLSVICSVSGEYGRLRRFLPFLDWRKGVAIVLP